MKTLFFFFFLCILLMFHNIDVTHSITDKPYCVVIDPGHGGYDTGATGRNFVEKNITLMFAQQLQKLLADEFNTVLTRNSDYDLPIDQRAMIANHEKASIFISIHTYGNFVNTQKGICIFYTDNSNSQVDHTISWHPESQVYWESIQQKHAKRSEQLASIVFDEFKKNQNFEINDVQSLPLTVLCGANMPAILIEIGNIMNPIDEERLNNKTYLYEYSQILKKAFISFLEK
ncbi:MAG: N-acetylmuramoyl-L-alanine amidase [Desulfobacterales bacterium]|nr:N-acetylmuramoyl-L-alanine amidase [Desulfobacterales bacterium]